MKLYEHNGRGVYIGSYVQVLADTRKIAEKLIREMLDKMDLEDEKLNISCCGDIKKHYNTVLSANNGDY